MEKTKYTLRRVPDEELYFEPLEEDIISSENKDAFITGNRDFIDIGEKAYIDIVKGNYYDEQLAYDYEPMEELKKVTGKEWEEATIRGYSQGDWESLYYVKGTLTQEHINHIENFYFGKVSGYEVEDEHGQIYTCFIPHDIEWHGKKAICEYLGFNPDEVKVLIDDGYTKEYKYKEMDN